MSNNLNRASGFLSGKIEAVIKALEGLKTATNYGGDYTPYHGTAGDSSDLAPLRQLYIREAETNFILAHKQDILKEAVKLAEEELANARAILVAKKV